MQIRKTFELEKTIKINFRVISTFDTVFIINTASTVEILVPSDIVAYDEKYVTSIYINRSVWTKTFKHSSNIWDSLSFNKIVLNNEFNYIILRLKDENLIK